MGMLSFYKNELKSIKLKQGPLKMFVAGGHVQYADAEWASQLHLSNGHTQIVRGLSVDCVTGPMGNIDMGPVLEEVKKEAILSNSPNAKLVGRLKAPPEIKGETDMLIGIQYNCIFPQPLFTTNSGLTLFKSRFLPHREGEIACVGGPSKALAEMVNQIGTSQVISMDENPNAFYSNIERLPLTKEDEMLSMKFNLLDADLAEMAEGVSEKDIDDYETENTLETSNEVDPDEFVKM